MSDPPDPNVQQQIDEAAKLAGVTPPSLVQPPTQPPPEPLLPDKDQTRQPEAPDRPLSPEEIVIKSGEPASDPSIHKDDTQQQNHKRSPRQIIPKVLTLLILMIGIATGRY